MYTWNKKLNNNKIPVKKYRRLLLDILLIYLLASYSLYFFGSSIFRILDKNFDHTSIMIALCCSYLTVEFLINRRILISTDEGKKVSYITCIYLLLSVIIFTSGIDIFWLLIGLLLNCFLRLWLLSLIVMKSMSTKAIWSRDIFYYKYGILLVFLPLLAQLDQRFQYLIVILILIIISFFGKLIFKGGAQNGILSRYRSVR